MDRSRADGGMGQLASESAGVMRSGGRDWREPETRDIVLPEFRFHTGEVMLQLRVRVTTLGHPDGAPVLVLHGTGGEGRSLLSGEFGGELFGPGQPLDAARHRIVLPDAIGHGGSAKPSDGLRAAFPAYDYDDMVEAHHRVLVEALGIERVRVVLGVSMGGMLTWIWGPCSLGVLQPRDEWRNACLAEGGTHARGRRSLACGASRELPRRASRLPRPGSGRWRALRLQPGAQQGR